LCRPDGNSPPQLQPFGGEQLLFQVHGKSDQIYVCQENAGKFALVPKALDAKLFDKDGKPFFKHFGEQTWEARGGSHVSGKAVVNADWKSPRSIPWQLNDVVNHPTCAERQSLNKKKGGDGGGLAQWEQLGNRRNK
jgi:hypothetical protein